MPPVPSNARTAIRDTVLPLGGGPDGRSPILVRKGQKVMYITWAMHRRTSLWGPDANEFRPERWEEDAKKGWEYLPFNGGPRICLGREFHRIFSLFILNRLRTEQYALAESSYMIVRILQQFDTIENADPEIIEPPLRPQITLLHGHGVRIRLYSSL
jgi:Cytochrome P450